MKKGKIIISGPPSSGKTTIINELKDRGYTCMPEISPLNIDVNIQKNKLILSEFLFSKRHEQYKNINNALSFYDRSLIDVIAYMNLWNENYPPLWDNIIHNLRYYKNIFYTPVWNDIYTQNNTRKETLHEAKKIDYFLKKAFLKHNYNIIKVPKLEVSKRVDFIIHSL